MLRLVIVSAALAIAAPALAQGAYGGQQPWSKPVSPQSPRSPSGPATSSTPGFKPYAPQSTYERPASRDAYQYGPKPKSPATSLFGLEGDRRPKSRF